MGASRIKVLASIAVASGAVAAGTAVWPTDPMKATVTQAALATTSTPATVVVGLTLVSGRNATVRDIDLPTLRAKRTGTSTAPFAVVMLTDDANQPGKHAWVNAWIAPRNIEAAWDASTTALPEVLNAPVLP